jgi:predicted transcriptional regulator
MPALGKPFMSTTNVKDEARRLIERLPDDATWDDLMYEKYVRQAIEAGMADSAADRVVDTAEIRARFLGASLTQL